MLRWTTWAILAAVMSGCGDGRPERVRVSGQVLIDGQPLVCKGACVRIIPEGARPATGEIDAQGRFTLTTFEPGDGCVPGKHKVAVVALEIVNATSQRWHAPKKYTQPSTSGLTVDITEPTDSLQIELTWGGVKGPILETFQSDDVAF